MLASANALAHSSAGLYGWAVLHRLSGWQAKSWPAEIDVFLAVGELALYVTYLDGWAARQRIWPWTTALTGLAVTIAGNISHIQPVPGHPVILADRLTAATSTESACSPSASICAAAEFGAALAGPWPSGPGCEVDDRRCERGHYGDHGDRGEEGEVGAGAPDAVRDAQCHGQADRQ